MTQEREFDPQRYIEENYVGETDRPIGVFLCSNGKCQAIIERWRGMDDIQCHCSAWYNSFGQRLRDDWQSNPSNYDSEIGDLEGFEVSQTGGDMTRYVPVPTIYLDEKCTSMRREIDLMIRQGEEGKATTESEIELLKQIRGYASVVHQEADEWLNVLVTGRQPPTATIMKVEDNL